MTRWFGVQPWPDEYLIPVTRQEALERASVCWLAGRFGVAECWLTIAQDTRGDGSDDLDLGGES